MHREHSIALFFCPLMPPEGYICFHISCSSSKHPRTQKCFSVCWGSYNICLYKDHMVIFSFWIQYCNLPLSPPLPPPHCEMHNFRWKKFCRVLFDSNFESCSDTENEKKWRFLWRTCDVERISRNKMTLSSACICFKKEEKGGNDRVLTWRSAVYFSVLIEIYEKGHSCKH